MTPDCNVLSLKKLERELYPEACFHLLGRNHLNGVPRAPIQKTSIRAFAGALLAANTELRINFDTSEGRVVFILHPIHAVRDGAIRNAGRRTGAPGAALGDDC